MNVHFPVSATVETDEYGATADVLCGAVGSYFSTDIGAVTCSECVALAGGPVVDNSAETVVARRAMFAGFGWGVS